MSHSTTSVPVSGAWTHHMKPVVEPAGWQDADYYCWGGLATIGPGEEGSETVHFFGARWPRWSNFLGWLTHSEVCRATSVSLTGPFVTREIVLGPRKEKRADGADHWDQHNAHNPTLLHWRGRLYLFYTGTHHDPAHPLAAGRAVHIPKGATGFYETGPVGYPRMHQRVGVAVADSALGPWRRLDAPLLEPVETWAPWFTTNPSACTGPDGRVYLYYKSIDPVHRSMKLGVAVADHPEGPYERHAGNPILNPGPGHHVEDHFVWVQDDRFHMLVKDVTGGVCGLKNTTIHLSSHDGLNWDLKTSRLLYSPGWPVPGGWHTAHRMEQGNLLLRDGKPAVLYASVLNTHECRCPGHPGHDAFMQSEAGRGESVELRSRNIAIALDL